MLQSQEKFCEFLFNLNTNISLKDSFILEGSLASPSCTCGLGGYSGCGRNCVIAQHFSVEFISP